MNDRPHDLHTLRRFSQPSVWSVALPAMTAAVCFVAFLWLWYRESSSWTTYALGIMMLISLQQFSSNRFQRTVVGPLVQEVLRLNADLEVVHGAPKLGT